MRKSQYCYERVVKGNSRESLGIKKGEKASVFLENTTETMRECGNMNSRGHSDEVSDGSEEISLETGEDHPKPWAYNPSFCRAAEAERPFLWVWKAYCQAKEYIWRPKFRGACHAVYQTCMGLIIISFSPISPFWNGARILWLLHHCILCCPSKFTC